MELGGRLRKNKTGDRVGLADIYSAAAVRTENRPEGLNHRRSTRCWCGGDIEARPERQQLGVER